jgi:hypothetical protein
MELLSTRSLVTLLSKHSKLILHTLNSNQLSLKHQRRTTGNRSHATIPVPELRRNSKRALLADAHIQQSLIPSVATLADNCIIPDPVNLPLNDTASSELEGQWRVALVARVEL